MDWRNNQFWRKNIRRMDDASTEFDLLVQRTTQRITIGEELRRSVQLLDGTSPVTKKVSGWRNFARNAYDTGKSLSFVKTLTKTWMTQCGNP